MEIFLFDLIADRLFADGLRRRRRLRVGRWDIRRRRRFGGSGNRHWSLPVFIGIAYQEDGDQPYRPPVVRSRRRFERSSRRHGAGRTDGHRRRQ